MAFIACLPLASQTYSADASYPIYQSREPAQSPYRMGGTLVAGDSVKGEEKKDSSQGLLPEGSEPTNYVDVLIRKDGYKVRGQVQFQATQYNMGAFLRNGTSTLKSLSYLPQSYNQDGTLNEKEVVRREAYEVTFSGTTSNTPYFVKVHYHHGYNTWNDWTTYNNTAVSPLTGYPIARQVDHLYEKEWGGGAEWRPAFLAPFGPTSIVKVDFGRWHYGGFGDSGVQSSDLFQAVPTNPYSITYDFELTWVNDVRSGQTIKCPVPGANALVSMNTMLTNPVVTYSNVEPFTKYQLERIRIPSTVILDGTEDAYVDEQIWLREKVAEVWPAFSAPTNASALAVTYLGERPFMSVPVFLQ